MISKNSVWIVTKTRPKTSGLGKDFCSQTKINFPEKNSQCEIVCRQNYRCCLRLWWDHAAIFKLQPFCDENTLNHILSSRVNVLFLCESAWDAKLEKLCNEKSSMSHWILSLSRPFLSVLISVSAYLENILWSGFKSNLSMSVWLPGT